VVPVAGLYRREATVVNSQGFVQRIGRPLGPQRGVASAADVAGALAKALALDADLETTDAITLFTAIAQAVPEFAGLSLPAIGSQGAPFGVEGSRPELPVMADGSATWEPDTVHPTHQRPFAIHRGCS